jgi:signal transduction histidine kinase
MSAESIPRNERDARNALADLLERRSADIIVRWLEVLEDEVVTTHMSLTELRNGIATYLEQLAVVLRSEVEIVPGGVGAWKEVAKAHAITRIRQGFDVSQLVHEFIVLRRILFEVVEEHDGTTWLARQAMLLADLVEAAVADSVASYVAARDFAARRAHAEHVGFVTHELRNPLSAAMTAVARLGSQPEVVATSGSVLTLLRRSLDRLRGLVDRVLETQRLTAGELTPKATDIRLGALMEEALRVARKRAEDKGLRFRARFDPEMIVCVDTQLSVSALQNVVDNAVKFTDVGEVHVTSEDRDDEVVIHVCDNCTGLSEPELATIFEPFERGHTGKPGTGLGLAIARRSIEAQGGTIGAESPGDRGCHFWLTLPKPKA